MMADFTQMRIFGKVDGQFFANSLVAIHSQGHQNNGNVDPKQGYTHVKFERSRKGNAKVFFK